MLSNTSVCCFCDSERGVKGFISNAAIKVIGSSCLAHHLSESDFDHYLVDLDLALRMQSDPSLIELYLKNLPRVNKSIKTLKESSKSIQECKVHLQSSKERLITHIEEVFGSLNGAVGTEYSYLKVCK